MQAVSRKFVFLIWAWLAALVCAGQAVAETTAEQKAQARAEARHDSQKLLADLYKVQPGAKALIDRAVGYATFSNFGVKILLAGGGTGRGLVVNRKTRQETFMKMVEMQAGLGFGIKKYRLVWVFDNESSLNKFINSGWELGAQATAAATTAGQGAAIQGALSVSPGVWLFQLTSDGLALELTAKGTKYYRDTELE